REAAAQRRPRTSGPETAPLTPSAHVQHRVHATRPQNWARNRRRPPTSGSDSTSAESVRAQRAHSRAFPLRRLQSDAGPSDRQQPQD
ncbi:hypothetical protein V5799_000632, partial [Amblyomma americanum]